MVKRLKDSNQDDYWRKFTSFVSILLLLDACLTSLQPAQRAFLMRGSVKKITDGTVAGVYGVQPGNSEKVEWLQKNFTFIYPHDYKVSLSLPSLRLLVANHHRTGTASPVRRQACFHAAHLRICPSRCFLR